MKSTRTWARTWSTWSSRRRRTLPDGKQLTRMMTSVLAGILVAGVAAVAVVSDGYARQQPELDDGSVWVSNSTLGMVGHANAEIASLSSAVRAGGTGASLIQSPTRLLVHDRSNNTLQVIDTARAEVTDTVPLPSGLPEIVDAGSLVAVYLPATGDVWTVPDSAVGSFQAKSTPAYALGADAVLAADSAGDFAGYSRKTARLTTGTFGVTAKPVTRTVRFEGKTGDVQVSLVGGRPAVYNGASGELWFDGRTVRLSAHIPDPASARLAAPTTDSGRLLIAHSQGLLAVDPESGAVMKLGDDAHATGTAARPVRVDGCDYAAWSGGVGYVLCGDSPRVVTLDGMAGAAPVLLANGRRVVVNDAANGRTWAIQRDGRVIDNWADFEPENGESRPRQDARDIPPQTESVQAPPVAVDDAFGARAGRVTPLPVLLNDSDPNGDPLAITAVTPVDESFGRLDIVENAQKLQLTATPEATGTQTARYTIDDGHGGTAEATVTITISPEGVNAAPVQVRTTRTSLVSGGTSRLSALEDWVDPDGDPIYLAAAEVAAPSRVSFTSAGSVEYTDGGTTTGLVTIPIVVSDGTTSANGAITITVGAPGTVPIIADSFTVTGYAGQDVAVAPLPNARGGTGELTLAGVTESGGGSATIAPDYSAGTFIARAPAAGSYELTYTVSDGDQNASGRVRLEIAALPESALPPVTQPVTVFTSLRQTQRVDVLNGDVDPAGGVLGLTEVAGAPDELTVGIVDQSRLSITLNRPLPAGPVTFSYTASTGRASAPGTVTVVQIPEPETLQPPVAAPDDATVRVGGVVDIPVLANDSQPDGKPLILGDKLAQPLPAGAGILFPAADRLRYLAPNKPGTFTAAYTVSTTDGQTAVGTVTITVRDTAASDNRPPVPRTVTAHATAGEKVRIPIPLAGIDPDGDTVTLSGQTAAPRLGAVSGVGADYIEYTPGPFAAGTDEFQYTVVDALGAQATGLVRVGVLPPTQVVQPPVAVDDAVAVRPGSPLTVDVTQNDTDPQGGTLTVIAVEGANGLAATHGKKTVSLTAPAQPGPAAVLYTVRNARGGTASAWLYLDVREDAPLAAPVASDVRVPLSAVDGRETITSDVLDSVSFSEGGRSALSLSVPSGFPTASVVNGKLRVRVQAKSQIIPYTVARKDEPEVTATAFVWVPGQESAAPELKKDAPDLTAASGEALTIKIGDFVLAAAGRKARIVDAASVSATYGDGQALVVDETTLRYASAKEYFGPASITFTVSDREGSGGNRATFTLPITVTPRKSQPPALRGSALRIEPGGQTTVDLRALTDVASGSNRGSTTYTLDGGAKDGVTATLSGSTVTLAADDRATVGATPTFAVTPKDRAGTGAPATISVAIVRSTRPLAAPADDELVLRRGASDSVDVLRNDQATNPFPATPLRVQAVDTSRLPSGVTASGGVPGGRVQVSVTANAPVGTYAIPYTVSDSTRDPSRYTSATLRVTVQDVPGTPSAPPAVLDQSLENASVTLGMPPVVSNGASVTAFTVRSTGGDIQQRCRVNRACVVRGLTLGSPYQFTAAAVNSLGEGPQSAPSAAVVVDGTPAAPANVALAPSAGARDGSIMTLKWDTVDNTGRGSAVTTYLYTVRGPDGVVESGERAVGAAMNVTVQSPLLVAGQKYTATVQAKNLTSVGPAGTSSAVAVAAPTFASAPQVARSGALGAAQVSWTADFGGSSTQFVYILRGAGKECLGKNPAGGTLATASTWTDPEAPIATDYTVFLVNDLFCTAQTTNVLDLQAADFTSPTVAKLPAPDGNPQWQIGNIATTGHVSSCQVALVPTGSEPIASKWRTLACAIGERAPSDSVLTGEGLSDPRIVYDVWVRVLGWDQPNQRLITRNIDTPAAPGQEGTVQ